VVNLKVGRVGGHTESRRVCEVAQRAGVPVWCGGMLESGVGRAHNVAIGTLPAFTLPGDTAPSRRYWDDDIVEPAWEMQDGTMAPPAGPGIGVELRHDLVRRLTVRTLSLRP